MRYLDPQTIEELSHLHLATRRFVDGGMLGPHRSRSKGASLEYRQSRPYVPGDESRRLDWRLLARTDRPFVKEYDAETNRRCVLTVDGSGSMGYAGVDGREKFDHAAGIAVALAYLMLAATEDVGVAVTGPAGVADWLAPARGPGRIARIIQSLGQTRPAGPGDLSAAAAAVADRVDRRAVVVLLSDFFQPVSSIRDALARLRHGRHEVICIRVLHPDEQAFPFVGPTRFTGMERETGLTAEPAGVRRAYLARFAAHAAGLASTCKNAGADLHTVTTDTRVVDVVRRLVGRGHCRNPVGVAADERAAAAG